MGNVNWVLHDFMQREEKRKGRGVPSLVGEVVLGYLPGALKTELCEKLPSGL